MKGDSWNELNDYLLWEELNRKKPEEPADETPSDTAVRPPSGGAYYNLYAKNFDKAVQKQIEKAKKQERKKQEYERREQEREAKRQEREKRRLERKQGKDK